MKNYLKTGLVLFLIAAVCASLCAYINSITAPVIAINAEKDKIAAYQAVAGSFEVGEEMPGEGNILTIVPLSENGRRAGYILQILTNGYGGEMIVVASYLTDGSVISAKLTSDSETPGLGKKAENDWYMEKYKGKGGSVPLPLSKSDLSAEDSAAVSGASITFGGLSSGIKAGSDYVKSLGGR